jgi:hypothetical protein
MIATAKVIPPRHQTQVLVGRLPELLQHAHCRSEMNTPKPKDDQ